MKRWIVNADDFGHTPPVRHREGQTATPAGRPGGVTELMCHPGCVDAALVSDYTTMREVELRMLTDVRVRTQVAFSQVSR